MFKIKEKILNILKRKEIILAIILLIIIISLLLVVIISNNKSKVTSTEEAENLKVNMQEDEQEYIDISELEENVLVEENNNINENTDKNNTSNNTTNENTTGSTPYYIKINYGAQVVTIYKKDSNGNYTVPVKAMVCSTGVATPKSGVYSIPARWRWLGLQGNVYGQYCTQIKGNILFHSVPYLERGNPGSLEYWEYDKLGTYASAGCIRLTVADAMWIYNNCARGTKVEFYSSSDPGPLGKPSAKKISSYPDYLRNWDPTDPASNNPWKNYKEENKTTNTNTESKSTNTENTQANETTNANSNVIKENETANEVNTNTTQTNETTTNKTTTNEIITNETTSETTKETTNETAKETTNNTKLNETETNDDVNKKVVSNEESLNTNTTL